MNAKIPIFCISNQNEQNKKFIDSIRCHICGGVYFEPIYLKIEKFIVCKNCFFEQHKKNNNHIDKSNLKLLFDEIDYKKIEPLFKFKYYCPLCKSNNSNNEEYAYDKLIEHLSICKNQVLFRELCRCTNIIKIYLKDIDMEENDYKIILENEILKKEIEKENLEINIKEFRNYLNHKEKDCDASLNKNHKKNIKTNIKKKFIGKKRKGSKK